MAPLMTVGTRKGLFLFSHTGDDWQLAATAHAGIPVVYSMVDPRNNRLWASLDHGHWGQKLHYSDDGGGSWTEVPVPAFPDGTVDKDGNPVKLERIWCIVPGRPEEPDTLYLGTHPGGLFVSRDGGQTFALVQSLWDHPSRPDHWFGGGFDSPGICSILVHPDRPGVMMVAVSCGGVFLTEDGMETWVGRNQGLQAEFLPDPAAEFGHDPHCMAWCAADPNEIWQQNHCGIFRSTDFARSWQKVSEPGGPAHFGFAIVAGRPGEAWVIPAVSDEMRIAVDGCLQVCHTEDGGTSWQSRQAGLPTQNAHDLVFRHAFDRSGQHLAFGTTTGNLYTSSDGGTSWQSRGHNWPPVYSVCFRS